MPKIKYVEGWLCRDTDADAFVVLITGKKPVMDDRGVWDNSGRAVWEAKEFSKTYGFMPRKGSCVLSDVAL